MPRTILVTGASGALGRHLVPELKRSGYLVRGQYCRSRPCLAEGVDWYRMNFLETLDCSALVRGCDGIIHLAGETNNRSLMYRVNVEATKALLAEAKSAGVRYFGYASSIVVYGSPRRRVIDESTPLLNPQASLVRQYRADPSMLEYARTKVLAEQAISNSHPNMNLDIYRPTLVADLDRLLEVGYWSTLRKLAISYRQTQYIYVGDLVAAIQYLMTESLGSAEAHPNVRVFNFADEECGTYRDILTMAYRVTGARRYRAGINMPVFMVLDLLREAVIYRQLTLRYSLGMLRVRNTKLRATGFSFPFGVKSALKQALAQITSQPA